MCSRVLLPKSKVLFLIVSSHIYINVLPFLDKVSISLDVFEEALTDC